MKFSQGMLQAERQDIDEISSIVPGSDYYALQHFISDSPWSADALKEEIVLQANTQLSNQNSRVLIIDEFANAKKGKQSVGVARQYCGNKGKVDNCQVQVAGYLTDFQQGCLTDQRLYLPQEWIDDPKRLAKAGLAKDTPYKSKLDLALEIVDHHRQLQVKFDWVTGDGFYGRDLALAKAIDARSKNYLFEIDKDRKLFFE